MNGTKSRTKFKGENVSSMQLTVTAMKGALVADVQMSVVNEA